MVMSAFDNWVPWPAGRMREMARLIFKYCIQKSELGIRLGTVELCGANRSMVRLFFVNIS